MPEHWGVDVTVSDPEYQSRRKSETERERERYIYIYRERGLDGGKEIPVTVPLGGG